MEQVNKKDKAFIRKRFLSTLAKRRLHDTKHLLDEFLPQIDESMDIILLGSVSPALTSESKVKIEACQKLLKEAMDKIQLLELVVKSER